MAVRHIEININFDFTTWAENMEDFKSDTPGSIREEVRDFILDTPEELFKDMKITQIWYEEED